ncbi:MAG: hypothetical protein SV966_05495 [Actinomycetota bacterium]|nr:hypothetical protein [Actinomycetota bacterium]
MTLAALITITVGCMAWSLWIRRLTWNRRWEVAATLNIALQLGAVVPMSPVASETLGLLLHDLYHRLRDPHRDRLRAGTLVWIFACSCGAGFALASAHSWRIKTSGSPAHVTEGGNDSNQIRAFR